MTQPMTWMRAGLVVAGFLTACSRSDEPAGLRAIPRSTLRIGPAAAPPRPLSPAAEAGRQLFFDKALSASGSMACATCHDPDHAYGPPNDLVVQLGGPHGSSPGVRAVPSLRYKEFTRGYADLSDNADGFSPPGPGGGFGWDGRSDSLAEQAEIPLLSPFEMANATPAEAVARLRTSASAAAFVQAFGAAALADPGVAFARIQLALQAFQLEDPSFHPYSSKYDLHQYRTPGAALTPAEERGLKVFNDPDTGNCFGCHFSDGSLDDGAPAQLTDFSYAALGLPRNPQIPANRDPDHADLGICGPLRGDHVQFPEFCGLFKAPTLRNAATRRVFFHNGVIRSIEQAVRFYNTRDVRPEIWYPTVGGIAREIADPAFPRYGLITIQYAGGTVQKFDDLPAVHHRNIDPQLPLDGRAAGGAPPMTEQQVNDLVCFLYTLTDDYQPGTPPSSGCVL